jgi:hypothetical protein
MTTYDLVTTFFKDKTCTFDYKKEIIPTFNSDEELVKWICNDSGWPYFPLIMPDAPWDAMYKEILSLESLFLTKDNNLLVDEDNLNLPNINKSYKKNNVTEGWKSVVFYSGEKPVKESIEVRLKFSGGFDEIAEMVEWTSDLAEKCPEFNKYFEIQKLKKIRIMWLDPQGFVGPHVDTKISDLSLPMNIALNNPDGCEYRVKDKGCAPFKKGNACLVNRSLPHAVWNRSNEIRIHVLVNYFHNKELFNNAVIKSLKEVLT